MSITEPLPTVSPSPAASMPKVMMLSSEYPPENIGGLGTHVLELVTGLGQAGCEVDVLAFTAVTFRKSKRGNVTIHRLTATNPVYQNEIVSFQAIIDFNAEMAAYGKELILHSDRRPDVIHCHDWQLARAAHELGAVFGIPVICTLHLLHYPFQWWWGEELSADIRKQEEFLCRAVDMIITVSSSMATFIHEIHKLPRDRIRVIYNGLDLQPFSDPEITPQERTALRQSYAQPDEKIVMFAGRMARQKGISALFASAVQVIAQVPQVRYLLVGNVDTPHTADLFEQLFQQYPSVKSHITVVSRTKRKKLGALYQIADIAVVPSIYEPFGYASVEAMAGGVPVIATDTGGLAEIIQHGQTGLLVPVQRGEGELRVVDVAQLAAAQIALLQDETLAQTLGNAGRQRVIERFGLEQMIKATLQVYAEAAQRVTKSH